MYPSTSMDYLSADQLRSGLILLPNMTSELGPILGKYAAKRPFNGTVSHDSTCIPTGKPACSDKTRVLPLFCATYRGSSLSCVPYNSSANPVMRHILNPEWHRHHLETSNGTLALVNSWPLGLLDGGVVKISNRSRAVIGTAQIPRSLERPAKFDFSGTIEAMLSSSVSSAKPRVTFLVCPPFDFGAFVCHASHLVADITHIRILTFRPYSTGLRLSVVGLGTVNPRTSG